LHTGLYDHVLNLLTAGNDLAYQPKANDSWNWLGLQNDPDMKNINKRYDPI